LVIGEIIKPHGVRGEVRVLPSTDLPERFSWLKTVYIGRAEPRPAGVEAVRSHQHWVLLKLAGIDNRDQAESLRGEWLQVPIDEAIPLEEDEYFLYQLVGLAVYDETGQQLGELVDVLETGANNVFVIRSPEGELLLPDIDEVIREIDLESGRVIVRLLPGLKAS
jgi:16S rRNA processing protein RimM